MSTTIDDDADADADTAAGARDGCGSSPIYFYINVYLPYIVNIYKFKINKYIT